MFRKNKRKHRYRKQIDYKQETSELAIPLSSVLDENITVLKSIYENCFDVVFRSFLIGGTVKALLIYIEGLSDTPEIDENVLNPLVNLDMSNENKLLNSLLKQISVAEVREIMTFGDIANEVSNGNPVLIIDKENTGLSLGLQKWEKRDVQTPESENVVRGPREAFVESLKVNTSLIRRKIKSHKLKMESIEIGEYTKTQVVISYIQGVVDNTLVDEINKRLERIEIDGVLESGYIEEVIEDNPFSPFPQVKITERVDVVAGELLEGRVAILVDGTPFTLIAPTTLFSLIHSAEDYYQRFLIGTAIRYLRYLFFFFALTLPAIYVAMVSFHQEMIPTSLLISIAAAREKVPLPALVEALLMEIMFEILREAGLRLPKQVGPAVSIVGALVIGEAAVSAGIVSEPMVIVVSVTGISSFALPHYNFAIALRMLRFPMIVLGGTLGYMGVVLGIIAITVHLCTLRSFGTPYIAPMAPMQASGLKDVLMRAPLWMMDKRPRLTGENNEYRQAPNQKPGPQRGGEG